MLYLCYGISSTNAVLIHNKHKTFYTQRTENQHKTILTISVTWTYSKKWYKHHRYFDNNNIMTTTTMAIILCYSAIPI